jgi:chromosome partitioning protein
MVNNAEAKDVILKTDIPYLDLIPSHIDLVGAEIEMINYPNREMVLKQLIESIKDQYDFIIIDCSPSLGLITVNAVTAADSVIVPVQCEFFALEGLGKIIEHYQDRSKPPQYFFSDRGHSHDHVRWPPAPVQPGGSRSAPSF